MMTITAIFIAALLAISISVAKAAGLYFIFLYFSLQTKPSHFQCLLYKQPHRFPTVTTVIMLLFVVIIVVIGIYSVRTKNIDPTSFVTRTYFFTTRDP